MEDFKYKHLFSPITLAGVTFRNRIFGAPTGAQDYDCRACPTDGVIAYYSRKAKGGAASVAIGECAVDPKYGLGGAAQIPLYDRNTMAPLVRLAKGISDYGAVPVVELQHAGMFARGSRAKGFPVYGPVAKDAAGGEIMNVSDADAQVLEMTDDVIDYIIGCYADAAAYAKACGFGMALIHGGHGWLLSQFLSPLINTRTDRWGGPDIENRARLPIAVCEAIRKACGPKFPIEFRMSGDECNSGGYTIEEGIKIARQLDGHVDLIHVSAGNHEVRDAFTITHPSMFLPDGANVRFAEAIKPCVKTPVATVGAFSDPAMMDELIAQGKVDVVEMARELICDPDMPIKARTGRESEIRHCMRCLVCFSNLINSKQFCCAINPEIGHELEFAGAQIQPERSKKVLVAGGGVGGMQAALAAAKAGHRVVLAEKTGRLGGVLRCERNVPFKSKLDMYLDQQESLIAKAAIDVRLNTEATPELARELEPDVIIAALGARPVKPRIPGIDGANTVGAEEVYYDIGRAGERVVILGGGLVGTELGIWLAGAGRKVTILEMMPALNDGGNQLHAIALDIEIRRLGIELALGVKADEINDKGVVGTKDGVTKLYEADTVVYAVGQRPETQAAEALRFLAPEFYQIGDCLVPRNIRSATEAAEMTVRNIR